MRGPDIAVRKDMRVGDLTSKYKAAQQRLIILDYDGVLVPIASHPGLTVPSAEVVKTIRNLERDKRNTVVLVSNRDTAYYEKYLLDTNIVLVAENGSLHHQPGHTWKSVFKYNSSWIAKVAPALNELSSRYEGTFVQRRKTSLAWYYSTAKNKIAFSELRQVTTAIRALVNSNEFSVYHGDGFIELYTKGIDAGSFIARWIGGREYDFIMSIAESRLDESMFGLFTQSAFLIRVCSGGFTHANYTLDKQEEVLPLLSHLK